MGTGSRGCGVHLAQRVGFGLRNELAIFARPEEADVQLAIQKTVDGVKRGARFVARDVEPAIIQLNDDPVVAVSGEIGKAPANFRRALWFADDDAVLRRGTIRNDRKIGSGRAFEKIRQLRRRERHGAGASGAMWTLHPVLPWSKNGTLFPQSVKDKRHRARVDAGMWTFMSAP